MAYFRIENEDAEQPQNLAVHIPERSRHVVKMVGSAITTILCLSAFALSSETRRHLQTDLFVPYAGKIVVFLVTAGFFVAAFLLVLLEIIKKRCARLISRGCSCIPSSLVVFAVICLLICSWTFLVLVWEFLLACDQKEMNKKNARDETDKWKCFLTSKTEETAKDEAWIYWLVLFGGSLVLASVLYLWGRCRTNSNDATATGSKGSVEDGRDVNPPRGTPTETDRNDEVVDQSIWRSSFQWCSIVFCIVMFGLGCYAGISAAREDTSFIVKFSTGMDELFDKIFLDDK